MNEEILRIQKMVAEGKVSPEEGMHLIESLFDQEITQTKSWRQERKNILINSLILSFLGIIMGLASYGAFTAKDPKAAAYWVMSSGAALLAWAIYTMLKTGKKAFSSRSL